MENNLKRIIAATLCLVMSLSLFTGCFSAEDSSQPSTSQPAEAAAPAENSASESTESASGDYTPDLSQNVGLNLSVFYNSSVYMRYTVDGSNNRPQSEYVAANGKTYRDGDFKPVWEELQSRLNFTINDVTPSDASDIKASFTSLQAQAFQNIDIMVGAGSDIVTEGVSNNTFLRLDDYLDYMPNFKQFLADNSAVEVSIKAGDGHIYYAPYFDGYDDFERMLIARIDWVEMLLDNDDAEYSTDRVVEAHYTPYMPESLDTTIQAVTADGSGVQTINKKYDTNIITRQNNLDVMNGANLVQELKDYIDSTYEGVYAKRSDLFVGQDAAYDADELVALMRCVLANTSYLTGQSEYDAVPFFPRKYQMGRVKQLFGFMEIWGVRGQESRKDWFYLGQDGLLYDGRVDEATMDGVERLNMLYKEKLILQDFDKDEATAGLTGSEHRDRLYNENLGFLTFDYNQTTTVYNSIGEEGNEPYIEGFVTSPILPPTADWDNDGNYYQFTASWRSVKSDGWAILNTVANDEAKLMRALALFDYMYSEEGNRLMSYGPEEWIDGTIMYNGKEVPKLSDAALTELADLAGGNYTNYYRMWLGGTFPIGYVKEQGMEYQTVHKDGQTGLDYLLRAAELGTLKHLVVDETKAENPSFNIVPTTFATTEAEELFIKDNNAELANGFREGNNDSDRILFVDYVLFGFEGTSTNGDKLLSKEGLIDYLKNDLRADSYAQIYNEAYARMQSFK